MKIKMPQPAKKTKQQQVEKIIEKGFSYEYLSSIEEVDQHIQDCEGRHTQQVAYSSFHHALTQICFGCKAVRTTIEARDD